jgi:hypothetical protein
MATSPISMDGSPLFHKTNEAATAAFFMPEIKKLSSEIGVHKRR